MKVRYDRLLKLAKFLDELPESHFDFSTTCRTLAVEDRTKSGHRCGTVGCAIGWTPAVFPGLIQWRRDNENIRGDFRLLKEARKCAKQEIDPDYSPNLDEADYPEAAVGLLGMSYDDAEALFTPGFPSPADEGVCEDDATPKQVADRIRTYVAWHKKQAKP